MNLAWKSMTVILLSGILFSAPSEGAEVSSDNNLEEIEKALQQEQQQSDELLRKSDALHLELAGIAQKLVNAAKAVQEHERDISSLEGQVAELRVEEAFKAAKLVDQREQFAKVLMSLERLARFPPEAMIAQPTSPSDTVRSAILLRSVVPEIERRAGLLRVQIESLAKSRERLNQQQAALQRNNEELAKQSQTLGGLLARKKLLKQETDEEHRQAVLRAGELAREAETLRDLITKIQEEQQERKAEEELQQAIESEVEQSTGGTTQDVMLIPPPPPPPEPAATLSGIPISTRKGHLSFPAVGDIVTRYGENNENGVTRRGIEIVTRTAAQVIAPYEGQVVFVGEFRGYGQLLIIEHSEGYHSLLAGMSRIDSEMGQWVLVGEPVGIMEPTMGTEPVLYVELRRDGRPINPLTWLASHSANTQG